MCTILILKASIISLALIPSFSVSWASEEGSFEDHKSSSNPLIRKFDNEDSSSGKRQKIGPLSLADLEPDSPITNNNQLPLKEPGYNSFGGVPKYILKYILEFGSTKNLLIWERINKKYKKVIEDILKEKSDKAQILWGIPCSQNEHGKIIIECEAAENGWDKLKINYLSLDRDEVRAYYQSLKEVVNRGSVRAHRLFFKVVTLPFWQHDVALNPFPKDSNKEQNEKIISYFKNINDFYKNECLKHHDEEVLKKNQYRFAENLLRNFQEITCENENQIDAKFSLIVNSLMEQKYAKAFYLSYEEMKNEDNLKRAAELGYPKAQYILAYQLLYEDEAKEKEGNEWLSKAESNGYPLAKLLRILIEKGKKEDQKVSISILNVLTTISVRKKVGSVL